MRGQNAFLTYKMRAAPTNAKHLHLITLLPLIIASASNAQQAVVGSYGCGTGCKVSEKQLSSPTRMGNGWSKVLVELEQTCVDYRGIPYPKGADARGCKSGATWKTWYFAKCDGDLWGQGSASDGRDAYTQKIYDEEGNKITYNSAGAIYSKWEALCNSPH